MEARPIACFYRFQKAAGLQGAGLAGAGPRGLGRGAGFAGAAARAGLAGAAKPGRGGREGPRENRPIMSRSATVFRNPGTQSRWMDI